MRSHSANHAVKRDWLTAGFARFQPAPYLKLQGLPHLCQTEIHRGESHSD
jgi:hypothetical protein